MMTAIATTNSTAPGNGIGIVPPWLLDGADTGIVPPWMDAPFQTLPTDDQAATSANAGVATTFVRVPVDASPATMIDALRAR